MYESLAFRVPEPSDLQIGMRNLSSCKCEPMVLTVELQLNNPTNSPLCRQGVSLKLLTRIVQLFSDILVCLS